MGFVFLGGRHKAFLFNASFGRTSWALLLMGPSLARGAHSVATGAQAQAQAQADLQSALAQQLQALDRLVQSLVSCELGLTFFNLSCGKDWLDILHVFQVSFSMFLLVIGLVKWRCDVPGVATSSSEQILVPLHCPWPLLRCPWLLPCLRRSMGFRSQLPS